MKVGEFLDKFGDALNVCFMVNSVVATVLLSLILYAGKYTESDGKFQINVICSVDYLKISIIIMMAMCIVTFLGVSYKVYKLKKEKLTKGFLIIFCLAALAVYISSLVILMTKMTNMTKVTDIIGGTVYDIQMNKTEYEYMKATVIINAIILAFITLFWTMTEWVGGYDTFSGDDLKTYAYLSSLSKRTTAQEDQLKELTNRTTGTIQTTTAF